MSDLKNRLNKLESAISSVTRPYKLIRQRDDLPEAESVAIMEAEIIAADLAGFNTITTTVAEWRFNQQKMD